MSSKLSRRRFLATLSAFPLAMVTNNVVAGWPRGRPARVLLVTATAGFRHDSIPTARRAVQELAARSGDLSVTVLGDVIELPALNASTLAEHDVVCFANTSGELPLDEGQKAALLDFVAGGKGFVGTHSATDTFYAWPAYGELIGAYFHSHPWVQPVNVIVEDPHHPATRGLGGSFTIAEEIYTFRENPRAGVRVLLRLDPASVGTEGDHPLAWTKSYGAGRVYYNALGHFSETWDDPRFRQQLLGALRWAAGLDSDARG